jgi:hypothetical protein
VGESKARGGKPSADEDPRLDQLEKFIRTARELGCDESEERFAQVVRTVVTARKPSAPEIKAKVARKAKGAEREG